MLQTTLEPAPTVCSQDFPSHTMLQLGPQLPEHVAPVSQVKRQPLCPGEQTSKLQDELSLQTQAPPLQGLLAPALLLHAVTTTIDATPHPKNHPLIPRSVPCAGARKGRFQGPYQAKGGGKPRI